MWSGLIQCEKCGQWGKLLEMAKEKDSFGQDVYVCRDKTKCLKTDTLTGKK